MPEQENGKAFMIGQNLPEISPHEQIHEPLNLPDSALLARIERPCDAVLNFEIAFQATIFSCERRLDHTGKHTAHHVIEPFLDKEGKTKNKSAGIEVTLSW